MRLPTIALHVEARRAIADAWLGLHFSVMKYLYFRAGDFWSAVEEQTAFDRAVAIAHRIFSSLDDVSALGDGAWGHTTAMCLSHKAA